MTVRRLPRLLALILAPLAALLAGSLPASAHPMGNFSINHFAALTVSHHSVRVLYVVDMAEIPTFQELGNLNDAHSATLSASVRRSYLATKAHALASGLTLRFDGRALPLTLRADDLLFPPGAGGLPTERLYLVLQAPLPRAGGTLDYQDANFPDRAGWKEIVATTTDGRRLVQSSAPATSRSQDLTIYPSNATTSPPQDLSASLTIAPTMAADAGSASLRYHDIAPMALIRQVEAPLFGPGGAWSTLAQRLAAKGPSAARGVSWAQSRTDALTALIARPGALPVATIALSLALAMLLGALHAFSPGHGKTVVAAYIVGSRATARHAALLGLTVTVTHTIGVFALGLVTLLLSHYIVPDKLYPWLGAISGLGIVAIGLALAVQRLRALRRAGDAYVPLRAHAHSQGYAHAGSLAQEHHHDHGKNQSHWHVHDRDGDHSHSHDHVLADPSHLPDDGIVAVPIQAQEEVPHAALGR